MNATYFNLASIHFVFCDSTPNPIITDYHMSAHDLSTVLDTLGLSDDDVETGEARATVPPDQKKVCHDYYSFIYFYD